MTDPLYILKKKRKESFLDLYERLKALNSPLKNEREFEPHHRPSSTKTIIDSRYINNNSKEEIDKNLPTLKATNRRIEEETGPIKEKVTRIEDKRKDLIKERSTLESVRDIINEDKERGRIRKGMVKETLKKFERQNGEKKEIMRRKDEIEKVNNVNDSLKEMVEKQNNKEVASPVQIICKKLEIKIDLQKEKEFSLKQDMKRQKDIIETNDQKRIERQKDEDVIRGRLKEEIGKDELKEREIVNKGGKNKNNKLKDEIEKRLNLMEKSMVNTQNNSLTELIRKIEILNAPLEIDRKRDIIVLNTTRLSDNEKTDKYVRNTICHKCKKYGHTKKQCDRHNKIVKKISKLEFEKDIINELIKMFDINPKEIDQVKEKKELKSTNPIKVNKRKRNKKDIIMKLLDNLPNHLRDRTDYLLKLKDSIDIPTACVMCKKYGHHVTDCQKKKKEKTRNKQDRIDIKLVTL